MFNTTDQMAPWDWLKYMGLPRDQSTVVLGNQQILNADPNRVLIVFDETGGNPIGMSPFPGSNFFAFTLVVVEQRNPVIVDWETFGPLVMGNWFAYAGVQSNLTCWTVSMNSWPQSLPIKVEDVTKGTISKRATVPDGNGAVFSNNGGQRVGHRAPGVQPTPLGSRNLYRYRRSTNYPFR